MSKLIAEARAKGLWLTGPVPSDGIWYSRDEIWYSPDEFEEMLKLYPFSRNERFTLADPRERLGVLAANLARAMHEAEAFKKRLEIWQWAKKEVTA